MIKFRHFFFFKHCILVKARLKLGLDKEKKIWTIIFTSYIIIIIIIIITTTTTIIIMITITIIIIIIIIINMIRAYKKRSKHIKKIQINKYSSLIFVT